ncbi:MAG: response regulator [Desulfobacteraceae bacterium]|nr:response regulator [Desulfobacteraceae bacterium]
MDGKQRILVVEDDHRLSGLIKEYLEGNEYEVGIESQGDRAPERILGEQPDLVILDLMLPGMDGLSVCRTVRSTYKGPILILTAREDDMDQVVGLELGADDYVKKPIEPRVLLARIRAILRRFQVNGSEMQGKGTNPSSDTLSFGALAINKSAHQVVLDEQVVDLTTTEYELLCLLADNGGEVLDRDTILESIRGISYDGLDRSADVCVSRLRKKLGDNSANPTRIKTIWGRGYLLVKDAW